MFAVKGVYDGNSVLIKERIPKMAYSDVVVTFLETRSKTVKKDDGSLEYLFRNYTDDNIREPIVDFGAPLGNEKW
jgi:hypothetical protein